jgi:NAD(P)-dependent dehydrogenase (short-subunit alcohol dehydrogenase family)
LLRRNYSSKREHTSSSRADVDQAVRAIGENVTGVQGDVGNLFDLDRLYETVKATGRRIDIVVANAGFGDFLALGEITEEHLDKLFDTKTAIARSKVLCRQ